MTDIFPRRKRSQIMSRVKGKNNIATEGRFIKLLRSNRITGWRRNWPLFGKPDFTFPTFRVCVFVDGCFWHSCPEHGQTPSTNIQFWRLKLERNKTRDLLVNTTLAQKGWKVIRIWQHDLKISSSPRIIRRIRRALERRDIAEVKNSKTK